MCTKLCISHFLLNVCSKKVSDKLALLMHFKTSKVYNKCKNKSERIFILPENIAGQHGLKGFHKNYVSLKIFVSDHHI